MVFYPLAATLISGAFAVTLWTRHRIKPRPYLLAWAIALGIYAIAALTEVIGAAAGWNPLLFRTYYFFGFILVGALGLGTIYLLTPRFGRLALAILSVLGLIGLAGVLGANLQGGLLQTHEVPSLNAIAPERGLLNIAAIAMAAIINIVGTVVLVGGALWSAYGLWRRGLPANRLWANLLIAAGAFVVAGASSLTRLGIYELFYVGQAVGVLVMFAGFLTAERAPSRVTQPAPAA